METRKFYHTSLSSSMEKRIPLVFAMLTLSIDTCKIYFKNGRVIMALIATLTISLQTLLFLFKSYYVEPSMAHSMISLSFNPSTRRDDYTDISFGRYNDMKRRWRVESAFFLINSIISFFLAIATTQASAFIHGNGKAIPIKDLVLNVVRSMKRPFLTCFYIALLSIGSIFLCLFTLLSVSLIVGNSIGVIIASILLAISAIVFYTYLSVVWTMSFVVSTLEDKSGFEALAKAARIVNGIKLRGLILNLGINVISLISLQCLGVIQYSAQLSKATKMVASLVVVNSVWVAKMVGHTAYTVLYFEGKKAHGEEEEIELLQAADDHNYMVEYTKVPTIPPTSDNIIP